MNNPAGVFQIEEVERRKWREKDGDLGHTDLVDIIAHGKGVKIRRTI
jgi:hypothetical protein